MISSQRSSVDFILYFFGLPFTPRHNMFSLMPHFLFYILHQGIHFLACFILNLFPQPSASFREKLAILEALLKTEKESSEAVRRALKEVNSFSPHVQIIPKGIWPKESTNRVSIQTHLKSNFGDAIRLIQDTGRKVSISDERYLWLLLTHTCGWSATYPEHMNDDWVEFFHIRYPRLKGLVPILDSMIYREELPYFPFKFLFCSPQFFLLATFNCYYIYDATDGEDALRIAGKTLEEVYTGLMEWRWADSSDNPWDFYDWDDYINPTDYFPTYYSYEKGKFVTYDGPGRPRNIEIP